MANVTYIAPVKAESTIHKIRCAAYCRVSSSSEDQLHSYAAQVKFYSTKFNGSDTEELVDIYADATVIIGLKQNPTHGRRFSPIFFA